MVLPQKKTGGAGLDEKENLRWLLDGGKTGERLLDPVVEDPEIFATQAFDEVTARIGENHSDIYAVNADVNRLVRPLPIFLGIGEKTRVEHGGKDPCRLHKTKRVHRSATQPTGPSGCPSNPSTKLSERN